MLFCVRNSLISRLGVRAAPVGVLHGEVPRLAQQRVVGPQSARPSAPPPSPAAGWMYSSSKPVSRRIRVLATLFRRDSASHAQPSSARFVFCNAARHAQQHFFGHLLNAGGDVRIVLVQLAQFLII